MLDQVFSSLSGYLQTNPVTILPVVFVVWTFLASKILRLSWWIVNIVGIIPVLGLYFDNPFSAWIAQYDPAIFLTVAWILEFAALFGLCLGRAALGVSKAGSGVLSGLLTLLLWASALFVGALFFVPGMVEDLIPDWRASFGFVILITSLLALTIAMFRFLRASLGLLVWFAICLCIG
ncbi:MAG: hypothetical protein KDD53_06895, partial [Bdellovibrionales bacterium]|nr:hypothetical protein [Bdellovibrionales bacterium]